MIKKERKGYSVIKIVEYEVRLPVSANHQIDKFLNFLKLSMLMYNTGISKSSYLTKMM